MLAASKRIIGCLVFPLLIGGATAATLIMLDRGAGPTVAIGVCGGAAALIIALLERALPYAQAWRQPRRDVVTDLLHVVISGLLVESLPGLIPAASTLWPAAWPLAAQLALAIVLAELPLYGMHRLHHEWRPLWRLHAVHHSALRLYWLNSTRTHPLEALLNTTVAMLPLIALGAGQPVLAVYAVFGSTFRLLQHSNVDVRLGPLNWIFSMSEVHRWHHSRRIDEANANYGAVVLLWDLVFGTRRVPTDRALLVTSDFGQSIYIGHWHGIFGPRCKEELGYLPWRSLSPISVNDACMVPVAVSHHADGRDALDP